MPRQSVKQLTVNQNVRCQSIYPDPDEPHTDCPARHSARWKGDTVAFHLTSQQAIDLAKVLLVGSQEWECMTVTAFRTQKRKLDGTYPVTVTAVMSRERKGKPERASRSRQSRTAVPGALVIAAHQ
jgi:hypothetical protein